MQDDVAHVEPAVLLALVVRARYTGYGRTPHLTSLMTVRVQIARNTVPARGLRPICSSRWREHRRFEGVAREAGLLEHMHVEVVPGLPHTQYQPGFEEMLGTIEERWKGGR